MRRAFQQCRDKPGMQRMAGAVCRQTAKNLLADEREVAKEIENLVAYELVRIAQRGLVEHAVFGQHDRVLERSAADQARGLKRLDFMVETERSGRRDRACGSFPE